MPNGLSAKLEMVGVVVRTLGAGGLLAFLLILLIAGGRVPWITKTTVTINPEQLAQLRGDNMRLLDLISKSTENEKDIIGILNENSKVELRQSVTLENVAQLMWQLDNDRRRP